MVCEILKVGYDGAVKFRYPGTIVDLDVPAPWVAVECHWTLPTVETGQIALVTGDAVYEFFSPEHPYNAFRVHAPDGKLRGWYANVTYPTVVEGTTLEWHDLWLDLIVAADGTFEMQDEDELEASGVAESDPELYDAIVAIGDELIGLATAQSFPFNQP